MTIENRLNLKLEFTKGLLFGSAFIAALQGTSYVAAKSTSDYVFDMIKANSGIDLSQSGPQSYSGCSSCNCLDFLQVANPFYHAAQEYAAKELPKLLPIFPRLE